MRTAGLKALFFVVLVTTPVFADFAVTDDGVKIHFETLGDGTPIFLIAGGPGDNSYTFKYAHTLLRGCGMLVFVDNRGRGMSERKPPYTLENDLKDIEAVRQTLGFEKIVVFGHSYGGMVAMAYAARNPKHTLALITTGTTHGARAWQERNIEWVKTFLKNHHPRKWKRIERLHSQGHKTGDGEIADIFASIDFLLTRHPDSRWRVRMEFDKEVDPVALQYNRDVYLAMAGSDPEWKIDGTLKNVELLPELRNFKGPALIMGGRYDWICPPIIQVEIAEALRGSELVIFERSGHLLHEDEPLRFANVVIDFVQRVSQGR